jgi:hypothetical protein
VIAPEHQQALVIDASFIPKSGTRTYGLEHFRNSRHRRSEKGLEVSAVVWLDIMRRERESKQRRLLQVRPCLFFL